MMAGPAGVAPAAAPVGAVAPATAVLSAPGVVGPVAGLPGQLPNTPATEEIPTKPPVAGQTGSGFADAPADVAMAESSDVAVPAAAPSGPGTIDMVLSIVAALVTIALLVLVVLKVSNQVTP